ncbi:MAG TPA: aconitase X [Terriglobia bacterium]|nr:aconitase X [Terriglobia bacterium]
MMKTEFTGRCLVAGAATGEVLQAEIGLSFWGGVDPFTGIVIDTHHPLQGSCITGKILAIPSGRGSCTGSSVLLELILNGHAPAALVFAEDEEILTLGVIVAEEMFGRSLPVVSLGAESFQALRHASHAEVKDGRLIIDRPGSGGSSTTAAPAAPATPPAPHLALAPRDQAMLDGDNGQAAQVAMRIIKRMAELQGAEKLIDITQAHIDGCIYTGPASLRFAERLCDLGARVSVPTSLNAISVDQRRWRQLGIDPALGEPASCLADAYLRMGAKPTFTCAPYLLDTAPAFGEQIVWAESNAVAYANSVLGARTMKYPDYLDICIALTGRAPLSGCHLDAHRHATLQIDLPTLTGLDDSFYPLLGYLIGGLSPNAIPVVTGLERAAPNRDDLKAFGAAFATTSAAPMFHIVGVTPEADTLDQALGHRAPARRLAITPADLRASWRELNSATDRSVDLISLGNPHFSLSECAKLAELCRGRHKHAGVTMIVACGRATYEQAKAAGHVAVLEAFGVQVLNDTCWCMITEPVIPPSTRNLMTNSGKYAHYGPGLVGRKAHFGSLENCVAAACRGEADEQLLGWLG